MDKLYLVVHTYENTGDAVYLVDLKNLPDYIDETPNRKVKIYDWEVGKIGLQEVVMELKIKNV